MSVGVVGKPIDRVDGLLKVTGAARYAADTPVAGVVHAVIVGSSVARGRIERIAAQEAERAPGVLAVMTHLNAPRLSADATKKTTPGDRVLQILQDDLVRYSGQPVAVVVADTFERASGAAALVEVHYQAEVPVTEMERALDHAFSHPLSNGKSPDSRRGDFDAGMAAAAARVEATYTTPVEHHNPMEMHATVAVWAGPDQLTLYDATQGVFEVQRKAALALGLPKENVRVLSPFVGGGFGGKGSVWSHVVLAAMAAKQVGRPVKLVLTRMQMFDFVGFRPRTIQKIALGATRAGVLTAIKHEGTSHTSTFDEFTEPVAAATRMLYACPSAVTSHRLVRVDAGTPQFMRAPGESSGTFALESAMDELAVALAIDPVELRLRNYAERDPQEDKPWSSKSLRECYRRGVERFEWSRRKPAPRSMRDGKLLVGMGMATATYPVNRNAAGAMARMLADGTVLVQSGSQDIGPGTYTVMTQIAADALGIPAGSVRFELGDTRMPKTPGSGGSMTAASTGSAVQAACSGLQRKLLRMAIDAPGSPLHGVDEKDLVVEDGHIHATSDPRKAETYAAILGREGLKQVEEQAESKPGPEKEQLSMHSFGAQFAEVRVDPDTGTVRVVRWTGVFAAGRILNAKLARSQFIGGVVWGIGMALTERTVMDHRAGRFVTRDLSDYHVPVNADVPETIDVSWVDEEDPRVNPVGVKGIGELGLTGAAAAIANAIFHATGKRIRDLPITVDKLL
jgi:xanthine dehydrogenase YagR molybdenum-binding subunit